MSGKVRSGNLAGPSRLNLALYSEDNKLYASTFTDETGAYAFEASPGSIIYSMDFVENKILRQIHRFDNRQYTTVC